MSRWGKKVDEALDRELPAADAYPVSIHEAMRYSVFSGGKRIRPVLCVAGCEAVAGDPARVIATAAAIEMIHTYSLIHDDLPGMDDDELRRGRPTCHKKFGEAVAILAGDALLTEAFAVIARDPGLDPWLKNVAAAELARAAGSRGMVGGQVVDMEKEGHEFSAADVEYIHEHKTAAMIAASVAVGAIIGNGSEEQIESLREYGRAVGLAFQAADDLLNVSGGVETGKGVGTDATRGKATCPALLGIEGSRQRARQLCESAINAVSDLGPRAEPLRAMARFVVDRKK
jgi:geranylgeranyl diphosphate synthase type II